MWNSIVIIINNNDGEGMVLKCHGFLFVSNDGEDTVAKFYVLFFVFRPARQSHAASDRPRFLSVLGKGAGVTGPGVYVQDSL